MKLFFLPFLYSYRTRFKKPIKFLSWFFIYLLPLFLITTLTAVKFDTYLIAAFLLVVLNVYNLYEIGYIYNDTTTVRNETNPTMRLSEHQVRYYFDHRYLIYTFRLLLSVFIILVLYTYFSNAVDTKKVIITSVLLLLIFFLYNSVRGRVNIPLHFALVILRFSCVPLVFYISTEQVELIVLTILLFPVPNLIERAGETRFAYKLFQHKYFLNRDLFRNIYYLNGLILAVLISEEIFSLSSILFCYFLSFRFFSSQMIPSKSI